MMRNTVIFLLIVLLTSTTLLAEIPRLLNYQGFLADSSGANAVTDKTCNLKFKIYDAAEGGTELWFERHTDVAVEQGLFNVFIGAIEQIELPFDRPYWLAIEINGGNELRPRIRLTANAYSLNTERIQGQKVAAQLPLNGQVLKWNGSEWAPAPDNAGATLWTAIDSNLYRMQGNVGLGTANPEHKLDVAGTVQMTGLRLPTDANPGWVLTSNETGNGSWQPLPGGNGGITGTPDFIPRFIENSALSNSVLYQKDNKIGIGTTDPWATLEVNDGSIAITRAEINTSTVISPLPHLALDNPVGNNAHDFVTSIAFYGRHEVSSFIGGVLGTQYQNDDRTSDFFVTLNDGGATLEERFRIKGKNGNVGIGVEYPSYKLQVNGSVAGNGSFHSLSDRRYKENIESITQPLEIVQKLRGISFNWKQAAYPEKNFADGKKLGLIAQEVNEVLPEVVSQDEAGNYSVAYADIVPVLIEAIKAQQKLILQQQQRLDALEARLEQVK